MKTINLTLFVILGLLISCTKDETLSPDTTLFTGKWGGQGISVVASDTQVTLDFDCASGTISKKVLMSNNQFSEKGTYTQFSGNVPINADPPQPKSVLYVGSLSANDLSLTIKSEDGKTVIGKYTITKGDAGKIVRCL
jgi:hypothetical protein